MSGLNGENKRSRSLPPTLLSTFQEMDAEGNQRWKSALYDVTRGTASCGDNTRSLRVEGPADLHLLVEPQTIACVY